MVKLKRMLLILMAMSATVSLAACGAEPTAVPSPVPTPAGPLNFSLTTDADSYPASGVEIQVTLTNRDAEPVYLAVCEPVSLVEADTLNLVRVTLCEVDYLGHKIEAGGSFVDDVSLNPEPGAYRVQITVYGDCALGEPASFGPDQTNYGDFRDCAIRQEVVSEPFDVK